MLKVLAAFALACGSSVSPLSAAEPVGLEVEARIPLGEVRGRIDHLAADLNRQRLFIAELGNDRVAVLDLQSRAVVQTLSGLHEPQGVGYEPSTDSLYVASAGDGTVRLYQGAELKRAGVIELGNDADNVRVDYGAHRVFVGYGAGALAAIDPLSRSKAATVPLKAHPEGFQLEHGSNRIFVNVPDVHEIVVVDRVAYRTIASWETQDLRANFPLALDEAGHRLFAVFRHPARVGVFNTESGAVLATFESCADADDVFFDAKRSRVYVVCGEGVVDVVDVRSTTYRRIARIPTSTDARTGLFVPELDRLFVAARSSSAGPAAVWVFRPSEAGH